MDDINIEAVKSIGERIYSRRKQLRLTQEQVSEKADLSPQFFSIVERNKKSVRAGSIIKLAHALEVSTDYLLTGERNVIDVGNITKMLLMLDDKQFKCAEEILRNFVIACGYREQDF